MCAMALIGCRITSRAVICCKDKEEISLIRRLEEM